MIPLFETISERRSFLSTLALSSIALTGAGRVRAGASDMLPPAEASARTAALHDVRAFGAKGDGVTDDTAAFNAATMSAATGYPEGSRIAVFVPPGTYRIDGTVFVRKGQSLLGAGDASLIDASKARGRTIVLGRDDRDRDDPGGAPVTLSDLRFWGGSDRSQLIDVPLPGFALRNLFITSPGIAIAITGGDGIVSNVIIDQALNGIVLRGARNVLIDNVIGYLVNYAITIDRSTNDVALSNLLLAYSKNASILFAEGATGIGSIRVSGATFVSSIEYPTFVGHVHIRSHPFDAQFSDCIFRNWRGFAVSQEAGSGAHLTFANCTFDGSRSNSSYNASSTASGIRTGVEARFRFTDCRFHNLLGPVATVGPDLGTLTFDGGLIADCSSDPIRFAPGAGGRIRVRGVDGFGRLIQQGGSSSIVLPWWGPTTAWRISVARRSAPGGLTSATVAACQNGGTIACSIGEMQHYGTPLLIACGFGAVRGGPQQVPVSAGNGSLCVTVPATGIDWTVETVI